MFNLRQLSTSNTLVLSPPKPVTHVLFDFDGLLVGKIVISLGCCLDLLKCCEVSTDSENYYTKAMENVAKRYGKVFTWELKKKVICSTHEVYTRTIVEELKLPITPEELFQQLKKEYAIVFKDIALLPGVRKLLDHFRRTKVPMAIASASGKFEFQMKIQNLGSDFTSYFSNITLGYDDPEVKESKPAPDVFLVAKDRFPDKPRQEKCLVFEDSAPGVIAGCRAGMQVVWIPDPKTEVQDFLSQQAELKPTIVLKSIQDFKPEDFGLPKFL